MKIALLGPGKTGSYILKLHEDVMAFDGSNPPTLDKISQSDVVISFLPGDAFLDYIPMLIESKKPVVTGSTGMQWPKEIDQQLKEQNLSWIRSHNFSLGMNVVRLMIEKMSLLNDLFDDGTYSIHDIHHVHKKDAPSGTALSWKDWLGIDCEITAERKGDVVGYHHMIFDSPEEKITLVHEAKNRGIFAKGAIFAANILHTQKIENGLLDFNQVIKDYLKI
jgi:4-hydroxy-tetrahydrodipicolinate reductase